MLFCALALSLFSMNASAAEPAGDIVSNKIFAFESADGLNVWVKVLNQGDRWVPSFNVSLFGTKSGSWEWCVNSGMSIDSAAVDALDAGDYDWVQLHVPDFYHAYDPGLLFLVVDTNNDAVEQTEVFNTTVIDVHERWGQSRYHWSYEDIATPDCVLDELDPIFGILDAKVKPFVKAEVL